MLIISFIGGFLVAKFINSKLFSKISRTLGVNRTVHNNALNDIIDTKKGTWARVYLKNEKIVYCGAVVLFDKKEKYDDGIIVLNRYCAYRCGESDLKDDGLPNKENNEGSFIKKIFVLKVRLCLGFEVRYM